MRCLMYRPKGADHQSPPSSAPWCPCFAAICLQEINSGSFNENILGRFYKNRYGFRSSLSCPASAVLLRSERPRDDGEEGGEDQKSGFRQVSKAELLMRTMSLLEHTLTYVDQVMNEEQKAREFHANPVPRAVETGGRCFPHLIPVHTRSTFTHRNHYPRFIVVLNHVLPLEHVDKLVS